MRVPGDENVDFEFPLDECQTLLVAPGHNLMSMAEANVEWANCHHLLIWIVALEKKLFRD